METLWPHAHGSDVMIWMIHLAYRAEEVDRHRRDGCLGSVPGQIGDTNTKAERGAWHKKRESRIIYYLVRPRVVRVTFATFKRARIYILPSHFQRLKVFFSCTTLVSFDLSTSLWKERYEQKLFVTSKFGRFSKKGFIVLIWCIVISAEYAFNPF